MYKVTEFGKGFSKPISLIWESEVVAAKHDYHPATGYHGHSGSSQLEHKAFGDIGFALIWLNSNPRNDPDYVEVNNNRSLFKDWFTWE